MMVLVELWYVVLVCSICRLHTCNVYSILHTVSWAGAQFRNFGENRITFVRVCEPRAFTTTGTTTS